MKKFIWQLLLFISIITALLTPYCIYHRNQLNQEIIDVRQLNDATTLVLGDSHTECSIDPSLFKDLANLSCPGEGHIYRYAKFMHLIETNRQIKTLIISYHPASISYFFERKAIGDRVEETHPLYMGLIAQYPILIYELTTAETYQSLLKNLILAKTGLPTKKLINNLILKDQELSLKGGFADKNINKLSSSDVEKRISELYEDYNPKHPRNYLSKFELKYFHELLSQAKDRAIQIVLFNAPCHAEYNKRVPKEIIRLSDSIALECQKQYGTTYINMQYHPLPDSLFRDHDHINVRGAAIVTPALRDSLIKKGIIIPQRL